MGLAVDWIAVDWGTSNLRVWGLNAQGDVVFSRRSEQGMSKLTSDAFAGVLRALVDDTLDANHPQVDVVICGMAGARQGWMEAPYLEVPTSLHALAAHAARPVAGDRRLSPRILPGLCQKHLGEENVMRGEETQLLGLATCEPGFSGLVVMPGTHSKWVQMDGHQVERFTSAMTGELFDLLNSHSVLRHSLVGDIDKAASDEGYDAGLAAGINAPEQLSSKLFTVRAAALLSGRSAAWCSGYLSGLLIGSEIGGQRGWITQSTIPLIGGAALCDLYAKGFALLGVQTQIYDVAETTLAGLLAARKQVSS